MKHVAGFAVWAGQPGGADEYRVAGVGLTHVLGQAKANADVIAAVPELLQALKRIVEWNDRKLESGDAAPQGITEIQLNEARSAIAKATGGAA